MGTHILDGMAVRRDEHGRLRLNDIHVQSVLPGEKPNPTNAPDKYILLARCKALQTACLNYQNSGTFQPIEVIKGRSGGTYAVEEIALDYAAWIDPELALRIQRGYIALRRGDVQGAAEQAFPGAQVQVEYKTPKNLQEALRMAADALDREDVAKQESVVATDLVVALPDCPCGLQA